MKIVFSFLALMLISSLSLAQTASKKKTLKQKTQTQNVETKKADPTPAPVVQTSAAEEERFKALSISYFGVISGSYLGDWKMDSSALPDELAKADKYFDSWPVNLWNQINFNYKLENNWSVYFAPRWVNWLGSTRRMGATEDKSFFEIEDFLTGFSKTITSDDKKLTLWMRPGLRLPTSRGSRAGKISHQPEHLQLLSYDINADVQLGLYTQLRFWVYEDRYNNYRYRVFNSPYVSYKLNDKSRLELYYENYLENRKRHKDINGKDPVLKKYFENFMLMYNTMATPKLGLMPFIGYTVQKTPVTLDNFWLGAWISYKFK